MKPPNPHQAFLRFFLILSTAALAVDTFEFLKDAAQAYSGSLSDLPVLFQIWFYGVDVTSLYGSFHSAGAYASLIVIAICIIGLKLCAASRNTPDIIQ